MNIFQLIFRKGFGYVDKKYMGEWCVYNNVIDNEKIKKYEPKTRNNLKSDNS